MNNYGIKWVFREIPKQNIEIPNQATLNTSGRKYYIIIYIEILLIICLYLKPNTFVLMKKIILLLSILSVVFLTACEDVIDYQTASSGNSQIVIDGWINDIEGQNQAIKLSLTQPYFENAPPKPALNATVFVANEDSVVYAFKDIKNDGNYVWIPKDKNDKILKIGKRYGLYVAYGGEEYISSSETRRVPVIDSITYTDEELSIVTSDTIPKKGFNAEFAARDFKGLDDTYLIKSYKNDTLRNKPNNLTLAWDAAGQQGANFDGFQFALPIRQSINDFPFLFQDKDKIKVEIYSIPNEAFFYISLVRALSQNGGLFATPTSNLPSNIINRKKDGKTPLGFFCTSAVSSLTVVVDKKKAKKKP